MNGWEFQDEFLTLWFSNSRKIREIEQKIEEGQGQQIGDLSYTSKSMDFSKAINNLFVTVDACESEEALDGLRLFIPKYYFPILERVYDRDASVFRPKIDVEQVIDRSYQIIYSSAIVTIGFLYQATLTFKWS